MDETVTTNGEQHSQKSNHIHPDSSLNRLPSPGDESSRMSFSSTSSSKESAALNHSDRNGTSSSEQPPPSDVPAKESATLNGSETRRSSNPSLATEQT